MICVCSQYIIIRVRYIFQSDIFIIESLLAEVYNVMVMKKIPMLYNGDIRCHGSMCSFTPVDTILYCTYISGLTIQPLYQF